jgi:glycosyltransferase involved in cell wall biosynthesis
MTPICQVELADALSDIALPAHCTRAMLVFRWRGRIVGRAMAPTQAGRLSTQTISQTISHAIASDALDAWVSDFIDHDPRQTLGVQPFTVSVVICTRERPEDLARALDAVRQLTPPPSEILVIDNAPTTNATREVVKGVPEARYVREDRRGLNAARNRALREARGDILAFTDDDAIPEATWLAGLIPNFNDPCVSVTTGLTLPLVLETEGQELFEEHCTFVRGFRRRVFDVQQHSPFAVGPVGAGANMAVRKDAVVQLGGFDERLDGGMPTRSGGDHDLFVRALLNGHRIVYDPAAVSWHRHRRTIKELLETVQGYGVGVYAMWTGLLVERREFGVLRLAWQWFRHGQLRNLLQRRDAFRRRVAWEELKGCAQGPFAWIASHRLQQRVDA